LLSASLVIVSDCNIDSVSVKLIALYICAMMEQGNDGQLHRPLCTVPNVTTRALKCTVTLKNIPFKMNIYVK